MIQVIAGTRPEVLKLAPVVFALRGRGAEVELVGVEQQPGLVRATLAEVGLEVDRWLPMVSGALERRLGRLVEAVGEGLRADPPRVLVVHGDTTTALAGALAGFYAGVPVAHVEAGLRSGNRDSPFPEEAHRQLIDRLSRWWFAPTVEAGATLLAEGCDAERVHVVGNTVVDALLAAKARGGVLPAEVEVALAGEARTVLVTCHRRENHGEAMVRVAQAVGRLREAGCVVMAIEHPHPATAGVAEAATVAVGPLGHGAFVRLLEAVDVVLTDSGGVQEECVALGRRAWVLREETERPEGVRSGHLVVVGTGVEAVVAAVGVGKVDGFVDAAPYGDGRAGEGIAAVLLG